jgi:hypothetical protein
MFGQTYLPTNHELSDLFKKIYPMVFAKGNMCMVNKLTTPDRFFSTDKKFHYNIESFTKNTMKWPDFSTKY